MKSNDKLNPLEESKNKREITFYLPQKVSSVKKYTNASSDIAATNSACNKTVQSIYGTFCLKPHFQTNRFNFNSRQYEKKPTTLPEPRADKNVRVCCDYFVLTEIARLGEPTSLCDGHPTI